MLVTQPGRVGGHARSAAGGRTTMRDETVVEPFTVQEFYLDGFAGYQVRNGMMFCCGFRFQEPSKLNGDPLKIVQVKLIFPVSTIAETRESADAAMRFPLLPNGLLPRKMIS